MDEKTLEKIAGTVAEHIGKDLDEKVSTTVKTAIENEVSDKISEQVETKLAEIKGDFEEKFSKIDSFKEKDLKGGDTTKDVASFAKFLRGVGLKNESLIKEVWGETKAMGELNGSEGGFLVPEELDAEIWRIEGMFGIIRSQAKILPMSREKRGVNRLGTNVTTYWADHGVALTESSPTVERLELQARGLTGLTMFERELWEDADVDLVRELTGLFAEKMAEAEDEEAFNGIGDPFVGILNDADVTVVTMTTGDNTFEELEPDDLRSVITQMPRKALRRAAWYMSSYAWEIIQTLKQNSQYISAFSTREIISPTTFSPEEIADSAGMLWGRPVFITDALPGAADSGASTKWIVFANMDYFLLGVRKDTEIKLAEEATIGSVNLFETNQSALRLIRRVAMSVGIPEAFVVLKTAAAT